MNRRQLWPKLKRRDRSTIRLALSYLGVMMAISLVFSGIFYVASASTLHVSTSTQVSPLAKNSGSASGRPLPQLESPAQVLSRQTAALKSRLLTRLLLLNALVLVVGSDASYYLARRTLRPIESAMEAQERFFADASHELKTPVTAIRISGEVALRDAKLSLATAKAAIASNVEQAAAMERLVKSLLSIARGDSRQPLPLQSVALAEAAREAARQCAGAAQAKSISIACDAPAITVLGSPQELTQAIVILLDNAIKYSGDGSRIQVQGSSGKRTGRLSVRDEGPGIRAAALSHIFERFYQVDSSHAKQGFGLGLPIAKQIVEQQHGTLSVKSSPGQGSTFTITLPLAKTS